MEPWHYREVVAVSRYWTPDHLDVTDVPITYARPKPAWIDNYDRKRHWPIDQDRLARRRLNCRAVCDPSDIAVLPPIVVDETELESPMQRGLHALYDAVARLRPNSREPAYASSRKPAYTRPASASGIGE